MIPANIRLSLFAAAALGALPVAAIAQSTSGQDLSPDGRGAYVSVAGAVDGFEVRAGEIALAKPRRPEVRQFAQAIVEAHRQGLERLLAAARTLRALAEAAAPVEQQHLDQARGLQ